MHRTVSRLVLRGAVWCLFLSYFAWNMAWTTRGAVPPSMFLGLTGLPGPTTGLTRSVEALSRGDVAGSLAWHPLTLPIVAMFVVSSWWLVRSAVARRRLFPTWGAWTWMALLAVSWAAKLVS